MKSCLWWFMLFCGTFWILPPKNCPIILAYRKQQLSCSIFNLYAKYIALQKLWKSKEKIWFSTVSLRALKKARAIYKAPSCLIWSVNKKVNHYFWCLLITTSNFIAFTSINNKNLCSYCPKSCFPQRVSKLLEGNLSFVFNERKLYRFGMTLS